MSDFDTVANGHQHSDCDGRAICTCGFGPALDRIEAENAQLQAENEWLMQDPPGLGQATRDLLAENAQLRGDRDHYESLVYDLRSEKGQLTAEVAQLREIANRVEFLENLYLEERKHAEENARLREVVRSTAGIHLRCCGVTKDPLAYCVHDMARSALDEGE